MQNSFQDALSSIHEIHSDIKKHPSFTLREELALGHGVKWNSSRNIKLQTHPKFPEILEYMREGKAGDFKDFGIYDRAEIWKIWKISKNVPILDKLLPGVLDLSIELNHPHPTAESLMSASEVCQNETSTLLALKAFVVRSGLEKNFLGYMPQTSPVTLAESMMFGSHLSPRDHKSLCCRWALDFETTPCKVNTFIWLIGMRIREAQLDLTTKAYNKGLKAQRKES